MAIVKRGLKRKPPRCENQHPSRQEEGAEEHFCCTGGGILHHLVSDSPDHVEDMTLLLCTAPSPHSDGCMLACASARSASRPLDGSTPPTVQPSAEEEEGGGEACESSGSNGEQRPAPTSLPAPQPDSYRETRVALESHANGCAEKADAVQGPEDEGAENNAR